MIKLSTRKVYNYATVSVVVESTEIDMGMLDYEELVALLAQLKDMVDNVEWLVSVTEETSHE